MNNLEELNVDILNFLFNSNIRPRIQLNKDDKYSTNFNTEELNKINKLLNNFSTVVGIDIYKYSQFEKNKQIFIPHLFESLFEETWQLIRPNYDYLFQNYNRIGEVEDNNKMNYKDYFISTGDGGFQILETPIHGIIFILTFATILRLYNSDLFMRKLHSKVGKIEVRYAITYDNVYKYKDNFYGTAIINNSRIMSKDKLNRLLIDNNSYDWFLDRIIGIENLMSISLKDLIIIDDFLNFDQERIESDRNALIPKEANIISKEGLKSIDVQKIGEIKQKQTLLDIYNLHIQAVVEYSNLFKQERIITVSVGNLNVTGIENDEI